VFFLSLQGEGKHNVVHYANMTEARTPEIASASRRAARTFPTVAFLALSLLIIVADQWAKAWVRQAIPLHTSLPLMPGVFQFTHTQNRGMAFSLLWGRTDMLVAAAFIVIGVILYALYRRRKGVTLLYGLSLTLPLGGAIGNLIDRIKDHYVTDFLDFKLINFPIFNVADAAITVGIFLLAVRNFLAQPDKPEVEK
jgi:signal peptidase II